MRRHRERHSKLGPNQICLGRSAAYETSTRLSLPLFFWSGAAELEVSAVVDDSRSEPSAFFLRAFFHTGRRVLWYGCHRICPGLVRVHRRRGATTGHSEHLGSGSRYLRDRCFTRFSTVLIYAAAQAGEAIQQLG